MNRDCRQNFMTLFIDTTQGELTTVRLHDADFDDELQDFTPRRSAQTLLTLIENLLQKHHRQISHLTEIEVNAGPGSFTGTRVGVTVANTLGFALQIPVNHLPVGQIVQPKYAQPPHITVKHP